MQAARNDQTGSIAVEALSRRTGYVLIKLGEAVKAGAERTLSEIGLTGRQFDLMASVGADDTLSQREAAELLGLDPNVLGDIVDELERRRLIVRSRSREDRRRHALSLTPNGRLLLQKADAAMTAGEQKLLLALTDKEARSLHELTSRLLRNYWPIRHD
jgi:DNA-binding MarR family transcriptional regulator